RHVSGGGRAGGRRAAQFPVQRKHAGNAVEGGSAGPCRARVRGGVVRHGGAGDEGARFSLHRADEVLGACRPKGRRYILTGSSFSQLIGPSSSTRPVTRIVRVSKTSAP